MRTPTSIPENFPTEHAKQRHLFFAVQTVGRLLSGIDDALSQLFQFFVNLFPVILKILQDFLQGLGKGGLQVGVVIQVHIKMVADGMLDLSGLGFGPFSFSDLTFKVLVQNRDGGDFEVDALGFQIRIGNSPELGRNPFHAQARRGNAFPPVR